MRAGRLHTHGGKAANEGIVPAIMFSAVTMQFTWPGCPTLYYGDEVGLAGWTDPDSRRPYPWGRESRVFLDFHKEIIRIHKTYSALRGGSLKFLTKDYGILAYGRWDRTQSLICVFNNTHHYKDIAVSVLEANVPRGTYLKRILLTLDGNHITTPKEYLPDDGMLFITLPPISSAILVAEC
jgi:alpha-glucosidase